MASRTPLRYRLTDEERELANQNIGLAMFWSAIWRRRLPYFDMDEIRSACFLGLCHSAKTWDCRGTANFATWTSYCVRSHINTAVKYRRAECRDICRTQRFTCEILEDLCRCDPDPESYIPRNRDLLSALSHLKPLDRDLLDRFLEGENHETIGLARGWKTKSVSARYAQLCRIIHAHRHDWGLV